MEQNIPTAQNTVQAPVATPTPIIPATPKKSFPKWPLIVLILILIVALPVVFFLGQKSVQQTARTTAVSPTPEVVASSPTQMPKVDVSTWKAHILSTQSDTAMGNFTVQMGIKIPANWTLQDYSKNGCFNFDVSNKNGFFMHFHERCNGWEATYSAWPANAAVVLQQNRTSNVGKYTLYRLRITSVDGESYKYIDAEGKENKTLDVITVGIAPPNESTHDFFFEAADLNTTKGTDADIKIADQIAGSITLTSVIVK